MVRARNRFFADEDVARGLFDVVFDDRYSANAVKLSASIRSSGGAVLAAQYVERIAEIGSIRNFVSQRSLSWSHFIFDNLSFTMAQLAATNMIFVLVLWFTLRLLVKWRSGAIARQ